MMKVIDKLKELNTINERIDSTEYRYDLDMISHSEMIRLISILKESRTEIIRSLP